MGDVGNSTDTWGWHFRGQQLVFGLIRQLIAHHGLSSTSTIIFSGGSAGARGVMVLIDLLVKEHFPPGAKVHTSHTYTHAHTDTNHIIITICYLLFVVLSVIMASNHSHDLTTFFTILGKPSHSPFLFLCVCITFFLVFLSGGGIFRFPLLH